MTQQQILDGLKIIELSSDIASAFCGKLFSLYGAEVITIEPVNGHPIRHLSPWKNNSNDPEDSILFAYLGMGKKSLSVDFNNKDDIKLIQNLIKSSDGYIEGYPRKFLNDVGINLNSILKDVPSLSVIQVSPYGQTGPKKDWIATSLTSSASGGQLHMTGDQDKPPLLPVGHQAYLQSGIQAFGGLLTNIYSAIDSGVGDIIDLSIQEVQAVTLEMGGPMSLWFDSDTPRRGNNANGHWGVQESSDGWIGIAAMRRQIDSILDVIDMSELKNSDMFSSTPLSQEAAELIMELIPEYTKQHASDEIFKKSDQFRAPFAKIPTPSELLQNEHYEAIDFWKFVDNPKIGTHPSPSGPIIFDGNRGEYFPSPSIGEHNHEIRSRKLSLNSVPEKKQPLNLPLKGIRVVDMTQVWSGPYGARFLADMGAEVIKIEGPKFPDPVRTGISGGALPTINLSPYYNEYNRGKKSLTIDFKTPEGHEALLRLLKTADVFLENWSSGVADRNGIGYEKVKKFNPSIIYLSMPGFGHIGPDSSRIGYGPTIEQMGGIVALQGYENGPPHKSGISYGDPIAGSTCASAIICGLINRKKTGEGTYIVIPQRDGVTGLIAEYVISEYLEQPMEYRVGFKHPTSIPHNVYATIPDKIPRPIYSYDGQLLEEIDERWVAFECRNDNEWEQLKKIVQISDFNNPELNSYQGRKSNIELIDKKLGDWCSKRTAEEISELLQSKDIPASPVFSPLLLVKDPHIQDRKLFIEVFHKLKKYHLTTRPSWRMQRRTDLPQNSGPCFGQHNEEVLKDLGYSDEEIDTMYKKEVISLEILEK